MKFLKMKLTWKTYGLIGINKIGFIGINKTKSFCKAYFLRMKYDKQDDIVFTVLPGIDI